MNEQDVDKALSFIVANALSMLHDRIPQINLTIDQASDLTGDIVTFMKMPVAMKYVLGYLEYVKSKRND